MGYRNFFNDLFQICLKPLSWCWNISNHFFQYVILNNEYNCLIHLVFSCLLWSQFVFFFSVPKISCPKDVHVSLPADKDRVALDNNFPDYKTDFRMEEVISNIPDVGPSYEFPRGYTTIIYTVRNELNQTDSCSFQVSVKGAFFFANWYWSN